jgi:3-mercaptopyruvate sulfurtransferase SseA
VPPPQVFADAMNELGIAPTDTVVLYDSNNMTPSTRFWWTCDLFGVQHVRILEGGLAAWKAAGLPLAAGRARGHAELADAGFVYPPTPERQAAAAAKAHAGTGKRFDLSGMRPLESSVVDIDWVRQFVAQSAAGESVDLLLDARSVGRFEGTGM